MDREQALLNQIVQNVGQFIPFPRLRLNCIEPERYVVTFVDRNIGVAFDFPDAVEGESAEAARIAFNVSQKLLACSNEP